MKSDHSESANMISAMVAIKLRGILGNGEMS